MKRESSNKVHAAQKARRAKLVQEQTILDNIAILAATLLKQEATAEQIQARITTEMQKLANTPGNILQVKLDNTKSPVLLIIEDNKNLVLSHNVTLRLYKQGDYSGLTQQDFLALAISTKNAALAALAQQKVSITPKGNPNYSKLIEAIIAKENKVNTEFDLIKDAIASIKLTADERNNNRHDAKAVAELTASIEQADEYLADFTTRVCNATGISRKELKRIEMEGQTKKRNTELNIYQTTTGIKANMHQPVQDITPSSTDRARAGLSNYLRVRTLFFKPSVAGSLSIAEAYTDYRSASPNPNGILSDKIRGNSDFTAESLALHQDGTVYNLIHNLVQKVALTELENNNADLLKKIAATPISEDKVVTIPVDFKTLVSATMTRLDDSDNPDTNIVRSTAFALDSIAAGTFTVTTTKPDGTAQEVKVKIQASYTNTSVNAARGLFTAEEDKYNHRGFVEQLEGAYQDIQDSLDTRNPTYAAAAEQVKIKALLAIFKDKKVIKLREEFAAAKTILFNQHRELSKLQQTQLTLLRALDKQAKTTIPEHYHQLVKAAIASYAKVKKNQILSAQDLVIIKTYETIIANQNIIAAKKNIHAQQNKVTHKAAKLSNALSKEITKLSLPTNAELDKLDKLSKQARNLAQIVRDIIYTNKAFANRRPSRWFVIGYRLAKILKIIPGALTKRVFKSIEDNFTAHNYEYPAMTNILADSRNRVRDLLGKPQVIKHGTCKSGNDRTSVYEVSTNARRAYAMQHSGAQADMNNASQRAEIFAETDDGFRYSACKATCGNNRSPAQIQMKHTGNVGGNYNLDAGQKAAKLYKTKYKKPKKNQK